MLMVRHRLSYCQYSFLSIVLIVSIKEQQTESLTTSSDERRKVATEPCIITNSILKEDTHLRQRSGLNETLTGSTNPLMGSVVIGKSLFEMDGGQLLNEKTNEEHAKNNTSGFLVLLAITSITLLFTGFGVFLGHVRYL